MGRSAQCRGHQACTVSHLPSAGTVSLNLSCLNFFIYYNGFVGIRRRVDPVSVKPSTESSKCHFDLLLNVRNKK